MSNLIDAIAGLGLGLSNPKGAMEEIARRQKQQQDLEFMSKLAETAGVNPTDLSGAQTPAQAKTLLDILGRKKEQQKQEQFAQALSGITGQPAETFAAFKPSLAVDLARLSSQFEKDKQPKPSELSAVNTLAQSTAKAIQKRIPQAVQAAEKQTRKTLMEAAEAGENVGELERQLRSPEARAKLVDPVTEALGVAYDNLGTRVIQAGDRLASDKTGKVFSKDDRQAYEEAVRIIRNFDIMKVRQLPPEKRQEALKDFANARQALDIIRDK